MNGNYWSIEVGTNSEAVKNSLNALITCVKDADDAIFKATIGDFLDVQSAIDYVEHMILYAGDVITAIFESDIPFALQVGLIDPVGTNIMLIPTASGNTDTQRVVTKTVEQDMNVGVLSAQPTMSMNIKMKIYVNGVRYV